MQFFAADLIGFAAATVCAAVLIVLPGFGLATVLRRAGVVLAHDNVGWSLVLPLAVLPAADALLIRFLGMPAALLLHAGLALAGLGAALRWLRTITPRWWGVAVMWWLVVLWGNVDVDGNGSLYQSLTVLDMVKHAAVVSSIAEHGLPLRDPFFAREQIAGYYHYFYLAPALIHWLFAEWISARASFMAGSLVTGIAFLALIMLLAAHIGLHREGSGRAPLAICILLCCLSGLDLLPALLQLAATGVTQPQLDWWGEELRWPAMSILWVPHHVSAVIAVFTAVLLLVQMANAAQKRQRLWLIAAVAFALASTFGQSVWIAVAATPVLAIWWLSSAGRPEEPPPWALPAAGLTALALLVPQLWDLLTGRASDGVPLGFFVRPFGSYAPIPASIAEAVLRLILLPVGYGVEFGIFALGAVTYLRARGPRAAAGSVGRLLVVSAVCSLVLAAVVRSTVINNDFGWRAVWLAQIPAFVWTVIVAAALPRRVPPAWLWLGALGLTATMWDMAGLRLIRPPLVRMPFGYINSDPALDHQLRAAYEWLDAHVPRGATVQHNPGLYGRSFDFGLYGHHRPGVADREAHLFGAGREAVEKRMHLVQPVFDVPLPSAARDQRATQARADYLLFTALDPVWQRAGGPPADTTCIYRSAEVCVIPVAHRKGSAR